jgi:single-strand DNA-binding protein
MAALNKVILIGHLTANPELKNTPAGVAVTSFSIGVARKYTKAGEQQQTDFINIVAWRSTAEFICKYFKKGKPILVCGQLQTRSWTDKDGNKRFATEVVADEVSFVGSNESTAEAKTQPQTHMPSAYTSASSQFEEVPNDDGQLPF